MKCYVLFLLLYVPSLWCGRTYRHGQSDAKIKVKTRMLYRALADLKRADTFDQKCSAASRAHRLSPVDERRASAMYEELEASEAECEKD